MVFWMQHFLKINGENSNIQLILCVKKKTYIVGYRTTLSKFNVILYFYIYLYLKKFILSIDFI
jgi:hypothetical protein